MTKNNPPLAKIFRHVCLHDVTTFIRHGVKTSSKYLFMLVVLSRFICQFYLVLELFTCQPQFSLCSRSQPAIRERLVPLCPARSPKGRRVDATEQKTTTDSMTNDCPRPSLELVREYEEVYVSQ